MSQYMCSQCKTVYSLQEYDELPLQELPDGEGNERVCECGAGFRSDKWSLTHTVVSYNGGEFHVSTTHLLIPHGPDRSQWYETCIFHEYGSSVVDRYTTQDEAEVGHENIVTAIEDEQFHWKALGKQLVIDDE